MKINKLLITGMLSGAFLLSGCSDNTESDPPFTPDVFPEETTGAEEYNQPYRPWIHFSPARFWMNDPNGMVYLDGEYHFFYQYNPYGTIWGNMSWGHAISTDLIHWEEQEVALTKDTNGDIFSGCCVIDKNNTAGFGYNTMIAIFTSAGEYQQQSIAYSTDKGRSFTMYPGNPVIKNTDADPYPEDFRDPKVFWHEATQKWIMSLATGKSITFFTSTDLKQWTETGNFFIDRPACNGGVWECPDLISLDYDGQEKWVLLLSINPGGPNGGSATQYFVGDFDGYTFKADEYDYPLWVDYGMDNYAGVTWSNTPDKRIIFIGWMSNWLYAGNVPTNVWRGAATLPRELSLMKQQEKPILVSKVVPEIEKIAGEWQSLTSEFETTTPYQLNLELTLTEDITIHLSNKEREQYKITISPSGKRITTYRSQSGQVSFTSTFAGSIISPFNITENKILLQFYIDRSSVEMISEDGTIVQTNLVFPTSIYNKIRIEGGEYTAHIRDLAPIW